MATGAANGWSAGIIRVSLSSVALLLIRIKRSLRLLPRLSTMPLRFSSYTS